MVRVDLLDRMFRSDTKVKKLLPKDIVDRYKDTYYKLLEYREKGIIPFHGSYLEGWDFAQTIYKNKYYLKDLQGNYIETHPEDVFLRVSSFVASVEDDPVSWAKKFYEIMYEGYFLPGGRVLAGAGDLYRVKTLVNCFVVEIPDDSLEGIFDTAKWMARTYSYGGGVGVDISCLRPKGSIVHNVAITSSGAVSFMDLYATVTGLIGQEGRRGALMITIDVKHPDVIHFIKAKSEPNINTRTALDELKWRLPDLDDETFDVIRRVIVNNFQVRFANISIKFTDEFFKALEEEKTYGSNKILVYKKKYKGVLKKYYQKTNEYSYKIPSKDISKYELLKVFDSVEDLNKWLEKEYGIQISKKDLDDPFKRDVYGDYVIELEGEYDLAIRYSGDFLLYWASDVVGEIRKLIKAHEIWNWFVASNYYSAEPGAIYWDTHKRYSPSDYLGIPIMTTNPCSEIPLQPGGSCNIGSINLARFVKKPFTKESEIDWDKLKEVVHIAIRFLDNVVDFQLYLNPLDIQKEAAKKTRRIGLGIMGLADMLVQLGVEYDSEESLKIIEKVMRFIANEAYKASSLLAKEKGTFPLWNYEKYSKNPFFKEALDDETRELIRSYGLRNIALLTVPPTGTISNIVKAAELNGKNYIGVSNGIEPIFALYYVRRSESLEKQFFRIFHPIVKYYLDLHGLSDKAQEASEEELKKILPKYFWRTAHVIDPYKRVEVQATVQKYVDHSISSTINLPVDIEPETLSQIYLYSWKKKLKGVTVYRDGSRFPVLIVEGSKKEFCEYSSKKYVLKTKDGKEYQVTGSTVLYIDGILTTVYHALKRGILKNVRDNVLESIGTSVEVYVL